MSYTFDIIGVAPVLNFFYHQEKVEKNPKRSKAYLGSDRCTLDAFMRSAELIYAKPDWNWDKVMSTMVNFWLKYPESIQYWQGELAKAGSENLIVARIANVDVLRNELEYIFQD
ncbi:MAG: hypothetical protein EA365_11965 [Gloeocapsa sp. DLM2.Bin57]|nr:MAG: hypothetical protein EA365_11965 [Gloeocapsa sp. DLM2.Bin57]